MPILVYLLCMLQYFVYMLSRNKHSPLFVGVTTNLKRKVEQHKRGDFRDAAHIYGLNKLVYYEQFDDIKVVIKREKQLNVLQRLNKVRIVESLNPAWKDLEPKMFLRYSV